MIVRIDVDSDPRVFLVTHGDPGQRYGLVTIGSPTGALAAFLLEPLAGVSCAQPAAPTPFCQTTIALTKRDRNHTYTRGFKWAYFIQQGALKLLVV